MRMRSPDLRPSVHRACPASCRAGNRHRRLQRTHAARHAAGRGTRTLALGTDVVQRRTVQSSATGRGQLLFLDQTTLSLAPNTTIVLDRFVFDPDRGTGEIGLQLTEGALRFIGGTLSRQQDAVIRTPTSTIGIRGSSALILHSNGRTIAIFIAGNRLCVTVNGGQPLHLAPRRRPDRGRLSGPGRAGVPRLHAWPDRRNPCNRCGRARHAAGTAATGATHRAGPRNSASGGGGTPGAAGAVPPGGAGGSGAVPPGQRSGSPDGADIDGRVFEDGLSAETVIGLIDGQPGTGPSNPPPPPPPGEVKEVKEVRRSCHRRRHLRRLHLRRLLRRRRLHRAVRRSWNSSMRSVGPLGPGVSV
jgi:hypothetical protein